MSNTYTSQPKKPMHSFKTDLCITPVLNEDIGTTLALQSSNLKFMEQIQSTDPRQKENQDEQSNLGNQANELLEEPNNDNEIITTDDPQKYPSGEDKDNAAKKIEKKKEEQ